MEMAQAYFDAWNARDADRIATLFIEGGAYSDPNVPSGISGQALSDYASGLFTAFPDLSFEIEKIFDPGSGTVVAEWMMKGTNDGPLRGLPATGRTIAVPGADVIETSEGGIRNVRGYFSGGVMMEQLDMQVLVQPKRIGPVSFGNATYTSVGNRSKPGVLGVTQIQLASPNDAEELRKYTRAIIMEISQMPGYIATATGLTADGHGVTVTAWEDMESAKAATQGKAHNEAMEAFFNRNGLGASAWTSFWTDGQLNARWQRCDECGAMAVVTSEEKCKCGAGLPTIPPYW